MIFQQGGGHKHQPGGSSPMLFKREIWLMGALVTLFFCQKGNGEGYEWLQPEGGKPARWGHAEGLSISLHPTLGPRGLIRIHAPYLGQPYPRVINFISMEPVAQGKRSQSELERSVDGKTGLRFTSGDTLEQALKGDPGKPCRGVVEAKQGTESLSLFIASERMAHGAQPVVEVRFDSRKPHTVWFKTYAGPESAPMESLVLSATMGNYARLRQVWLADGPVHAKDLWGDYQPDRLNFAPWHGWPGQKLFQANGLARMRTGKAQVRSALPGAHHALPTFVWGCSRAPARAECLDIPFRNLILAAERHVRRVVRPLTRSELHTFRYLTRMTHQSLGVVWVVPFDGRRPGKVCAGCPCIC